MVIQERGKATGPRRSGALRGIWAVGLLLALARPAMAVDVPSAKDAEQLCPKDVPMLMEDTEAGADAWAFSIARSGKVTVGKPGKDMSLIRFDLGNDAAVGIVQIDQLRPRGRLAVACGRVRNGTLYRLPQASDEKTAENQESGLPDTLEVRLYDLPLGDTERARFTTLAKEREKALLTSEVLERERAALRSLVGLKKVFEAMEQLERVPLAKPATSEALPAIMMAQDALSQLGACPEAGGTKAAPGLHRELCREAESLNEKLVRLGVRLSDHLNALRSTATQVERARTLAALQEAAKPLDAGGMPEGEARKVHCERIGALNWLHAKDALRLVARAEFPRVAPEQVVEVWYGAGDAKKSLPNRKGLAVLLHQTPNEVTLGWNTPQIEVPQQGPAQVFAAFLSYVVPAAKIAGQPGGALHNLFSTHSFLEGLDKGNKDIRDLINQLDKLDKKPGTSAQALLRLDPERPTFICRQEAKDALEYDYQIDTEVAPITITGTRNIPVEPPESGYTMELDVCNKRPCDSVKDAERVRNKVKLEVDADNKVSFPVLIELAGTMAFGSGLSFGTPRYEPIGGPTGPDQVYELRSVYEAHRAFSVSLMFGVQPGSFALFDIWPKSQGKWVFSAGPSLLVGAGGGFFSQLNVRVGYELAKGSYITLGPSWRIVETATGQAPLGSRIAVERKDDAKVPEPKGTESRLRPGLSLGVSIDMSVLADGGKSLLKAVGVSE